MQKRLRGACLALLSAGLIACGGGAGSNDSVESTLAALTQTNLASSGFPWNGAAPGRLKRWELPIPVKTNGDARAIAAMDSIESELGLAVFDRTSIAFTPDSQIIRGIVVSVGTAFLPPGTTNPANYCANVAGAPRASGWASPAASAGGVMSYRLYVNLDNPFCTADVSIAIHEFGHALGMGVHFEGFGYGPAISSLSWRVLRTMYANAPGTPAASIVVK